MNADTRRHRLGIERLLAVLRDRHLAAAFTDLEWDAFLPVAERARLLPRVAIETQQLGLTSAVPEWVRDRLRAAVVQGRRFEREVRWEIEQIHRSLLPIGVQPVFLKGAGYIAAGLPCGVGRVVSDIDILVAESHLPAVETALLEHGWEFDKLEPYDERYYREWMHELPPMRHRQRGTILDVHHRILPRTGRFHPPTERLLAASDDAGGVRVLSTAHMVLHAVAHRFQDGEVVSAVRDIADIRDLFGHFGATGAFWTELAAEANALGLGRALYYEARYANLLLGAPVPDSFASVARDWAPSSAILPLMDGLVKSALTGPSTAAALALNLRAHWLRMPLKLLLPHLLRKLYRTFQGRP